MTQPGRHKYEMVAKTFQGLEDVLRDELIDLGAENVRIGRRMVAFDGDLELMYRANIACRTALRILKPLVRFSAQNPDELYDCVRDIEWDKYLTPDSTFAIDSTVNSSEFTHSRFVTYRVKDGIVDFFNDKYGRRPNIRLSGADILLNVHIADNRVTISVDSSGEPLSKRGYRVEQTAAPINEVLAAGIILKTGWRGDCYFVDPMCGSGTFLTEAALIAANINPGIYRAGFAFEKWPDFDAELFEKVYNDDSAERPVQIKILGGDIDPDAVAIARKNIKSARLEQYISLECKPFQDWHDLPEGGGILVTNPPYGERLRGDDLRQLFADLGSTLKKQFKGFNAWILGYRDEHFDAIGLKPSVKFPILNGSLECSLREYVIFDGKLADFKREGGSTQNVEFVRDIKPEIDRRRERRDFERKADRRAGRRHHDDHDRKRSDRRRDDRDRTPRQHSGRNAGKPRSRAIIVDNKGPKLPPESTVFRAAAQGVVMRSRRGWKKKSDDDE